MISFRSYRYRYPSGRGIEVGDLDLGPGVTLVLGPSASGKSTFLKSVMGLVPHFYGGEVSGSVDVLGLDPIALGPRRMSRRVGLLFQDFEFQLLMDRVLEDVMLGPLNHGASWSEAEALAEEALERLGIGHLAGRLTWTLSGGEAQLAALAGILATGPDVVLLDEPLSQLDPWNRGRILDLIPEMGDFVLVSEHRHFSELRPDRVLEASEGRIFPGARPREEPLPSRAGGTAGETVLEAEDVHFSYGDRAVLEGASLELREGEILFITGPNGSGKSTLLKVLVGLLEPSSGTVRILGRDPRSMDPLERARLVGFVFQGAPRMFIEDTVGGELSFTSSSLGLRVNVDDWLRRARIRADPGASPRDLSVGEQIRLAIASAVAHNPRILVLDEPSRGQDWGVKAELVRFLDELAGSGMGILVATHDLDFARAAGDRILVLEGGVLREA